MSIDRRTFLKCIVVTASAVQACRGDDNTDAPSSRDASVEAEAGAEAGGVKAQDGERFFPQSVASGDPRPDSVVLWTRVVDDVPGDRTLTLEVATDKDFASVVARQANLPAALADDNVLKVKVVGLSPKTVYYYRFLYEKEGLFASRTGRTKTAPAAGDDVPVRFAVANCQDFVGRYYNSWQYFTDLAPNLDFVIFLGDYIYETNGDPSFQAVGSNRVVTFTDPTGAIALGSGDASFSAAQSLSNYRDLYKTYRSDPYLQKAHELYPFVFIWDDHEYSDDCHGATATYTDGRMDEANVARRRNAERAFFEYVPLDHPGAPDGVVDTAALPVYPDTLIYRDLVFGQNVRLLVADYRTYRPDHLIPEDGYPATVVMDQNALSAAHLDTVLTSDAFAYINIDDPAYGVQKAVMVAAYQSVAAMERVDMNAATAAAIKSVTGNLALVYVNAVLQQAMFPQIDPAGKPRGLAWVHMGKRDLFTRQGSRYIVVKDTLDAYAAYRYATSSGQSEDAFGATQDQWLSGALGGPETWKVLVSSVSMTSLVFDLRPKTDITDVSLRNRYYLDADMWDGFPTRRLALLGALASVAGGRSLVVCGDIHAAFASVEPAAPGERGVPVLTSPAISSQSIKQGARLVAVNAGFDETTAVYRYVVTEADASFKAANPGIKFSDTDSNGFLVVELGAQDGAATFYLINSAETQNDYSGKSADLANKVTSMSFQIGPGSITGA
jgi:alkaline phosphatase D